MSGGGDDLLHRLSDERSQRNMAALIHWDIGMPERRDRIESIPRPATSEGRGEAGWCVRSAWLRTRVGWRRWGWTAACPCSRWHWWKIPMMTARQWFPSVASSQPRNNLNFCSLRLLRWNLRSCAIRLLSVVTTLIRMNVSRGTTRTVVRAQNS